MKRKLICMAVACALAGPAAANERESFEVLKQTTLNLIEALVESGVLTRDKADALVKQAEKKAATTVAAKAQEPAGAVRVTYVPEVVRNEIREQIKQEVLAQAKAERWAEPNAIPEWLDRIKWEGDLRLRYQADLFDMNNTPPTTYVLNAGASGQTRAADLAATSASGATGNTTQDRRRARLRVRLGALAKVTDSWSAGVRFTTGNTSDRVSTNQTLGQDANKYTLVWDRAYLKFDPVTWLSVTGGRIPNPWFGADLVWDDDLSFEGLAATLKPGWMHDSFKPFFTAGLFPIKEDNPPRTGGRRMVGIQAGAQWDLAAETRLKFGLAAYDFHNIEGRIEPGNTEPGGLNPSPDYGQYEYGGGLRQRGNTLFRTNSPTAPLTDATIWGLASEFRPVNFTTVLDLAQFDPFHVVVSADWVKNIAFDRGDILKRTGVNLSDGEDRGYQYKLTVGMPQIKNPRDWQVSAAYRYLGSDAVVDAFTDSDFGLGGANLKGYVLSAQYGLDQNAVLGLRWLSADTIDSPTRVSGHQFSVDVLQADVSVKF